MMKRIIRFSAENKFLVVAGVAFLIWHRYRTMREERR